MSTQEYPLRRLDKRCHQWFKTNRPAIGFVLGIFLAFRVIVSMLGALGLLVAGPLLTLEEMEDLGYMGSNTDPEVGAVYAEVHAVQRQYHGLAYLVLEPWQRWDTLWYLKIAEFGYSTQDGSSVFPPLYPLMICGVGRLLGKHYLLAAVAVSNLSALGALGLLLRLTTRIGGGEYGRRTVLYMVSFPTAFFLLVGYTESLFLLLVLFSFICAHRERWGWAATCASLATLTRLTGVLLWPVLLVMVWIESQSKERRLRLMATLWLLMIPTTFVTYQGFRLIAIDPQPLNAVYASYWDSTMVLPWTALTRSLMALPGSLSLRGLPNVVDFFIACLFIALTPLVWRRSGPSYGLYTALYLIVNLLRVSSQQPLVGFSRFMLPIFPVILHLARIGRRPMWNRLILYPCWALQAYYVVRFATWGFVA